MILAIIYATFLPEPYIAISSRWPPFYFDSQQRIFFEHFKATFDYKNPYSEKLDGGHSEFNFNKESGEITSWYIKFDSDIKKITPTTCLTKKILVKSRWADIEAKDQAFEVFDTDSCKPR